MADKTEPRCAIHGEGCLDASYHHFLKYHDPKSEFYLGGKCVNCRMGQVDRERVKCQNCTETVRLLDEIAKYATPAAIHGAVASVSTGLKAMLNGTSEEPELQVEREREM